MLFYLQALLPKLRQKTQVKEAPAAKKQVKFVDPTAADKQVRKIPVNRFEFRIQYLLSTGR